MKKKRQLFKTHLLSVVALCSIVLAFVSCANEDIAQNSTSTDTENDKNLTTFVAGEPVTRTSMEQTGKFFWESGDYIYVKDDDNIWRKSSNAPTAKTASFKFKVPGKFGGEATYKVYYPGKNSSNDQVVISSSQTQVKPNTTDHFGVSGDCGMADATGVLGGNSFSFKLDHQATYLIFQPYTSNTVLQNCYLTKIEVNSDDDITDTYTLNPVTGTLSGTGSGKQIVLTTQGSGAYANGFPLTNTTADVETNGAYMVIKPGTHTLKIRYWVKDIVTNVEGSITKVIPSRGYAANTYYNLAANLNTRVYSGHDYYTWDAQKNYWFGYEWDSANPTQPTTNGTTGSNAPAPVAGSDASRHPTGAVPFQYLDATTSLFMTLPNSNEISWYVMKGSPRWDADELWVTMGHLYKGGIWLKKIDKIATDEHVTQAHMKVVAADNTTDLRNNYGIFDNPPSTTLPTATELSDYFYLPALGGHPEGYVGWGFGGSGTLNDVGVAGHFWSSSSYTGYVGPGLSYSSAQGMTFNSSKVSFARFEIWYGAVAMPFE